MLTVAKESRAPEDLAAYRPLIGKSAGYYLSQFAPLQQGKRWSASWNWAAFLFGWYWLLYRGMRGYALLYFFLAGGMFAIVPPFLQAAWFVSSKAERDIFQWDASNFILNIYLLTLMVALPTWANALYFRHIRSKLKKLPPDARQDLVQQANATGPDGPVDIRSRLGSITLGIAMAILFGWYVSTTNFGSGKGSEVQFAGKDPRAANSILSIVVVAPGDATDRFREVGYGDLPAFLRDNPTFTIRLPPGKACWPEPPAGDGTRACVTATDNSAGFQQIELTQNMSGDRLTVHKYRVSSAHEVQPVSWETAHALNSLSGMFVVGFAGLIGFILGRAIGTRLVSMRRNHRL